jgi:lipoprotein-anchoring transpeptidase ErfK/SrfK
MRSLFYTTTTIGVLLFSLLCFGCQPMPGKTSAQSQPGDTSTSQPDSNANAPATPSPAPATAVEMPVTLPVLDAFFSDDAFAVQLKQKLNLTNDQIAKLRKAAREETASLRENKQDESAEEARKRATEKITAIMGAEKENQLTDFVNSRWNEGSKVELSATPNSIPTDTRIVVNAPAYRMDVFDNGNLVKSYRVSVGYPEFPLPTGLRLAHTIIFNPTWTPPDEPWVANSTTVSVGEKIEAGSKLNPLGPIKIPIGLPSLIHGGKPLAKIGTVGSHGCVGLTSPQVNDFALLLARISSTPLSNDQEAGYESTPSHTRQLTLKTPVPVELRYETILVEDGKLHIYRDIYDHDTNTEDDLRTVLSVYGITFDQLSQDEQQKITDALNEMSLDVKGKVNSTGVDQRKKAGKVTPTIKGRKEIVIDIAELQGKGYPSPVDLSTGKDSSQKGTASAGKRKR